MAGGLALLAAAGAQAQVQPYGTNDYGGFRNILPPGENGFDNVAQAAQFKAAGTYPPHANDQLGLYSSLTTAAPTSVHGRSFPYQTLPMPSQAVAAPRSIPTTTS